MAIIVSKCNITGFPQEECIWGNWARIYNRNCENLRTSSVLSIPELLEPEITGHDGPLCTQTLHGLWPGLHGLWWPRRFVRYVTSEELLGLSVLLMGNGKEASEVWHWDPQLFCWLRSVCSLEKYLLCRLAVAHDWVVLCEAIKSIWCRDHLSSAWYDGKNYEIKLV